MDNHNNAFSYAVTAISAAVGTVFTSLWSMGFRDTLTGILQSIPKTWVETHIKNSIEHEYDQKLEIHKAQLRANQDVTTDNCRADLKVAKFEPETRIAIMCAPRAEVIAETYGYLQKFYYLVDQYLCYMQIGPFVAFAERRSKIQEVRSEFVDFYHPKRIYLPRGTEKRIRELVKVLDRHSVDFSRNVEHATNREKAGDYWFIAGDLFRNEAKPMWDDLQAEFRELLGEGDAIAS